MRVVWHGLAWSGMVWQGDHLARRAGVVFRIIDEKSILVSTNLTTKYAVRRSLPSTERTI